jgi:hypothetical protein
MDGNHQNNPNGILNRHGNDTHFHSQSKSVVTAHYGQLKSMLMRSIDIVVLNLNFCLYIAKWGKQNFIIQLLRGVSLISKHQAGFTRSTPYYSLTSFNF